IVMRVKIQDKRADPEQRAKHKRFAPPEQVGERTGRHVGQEQDYEVCREDAVYLELAEPARTQEDRIDPEQESARKRVHPPDRVVPADNIADCRSIRSCAFHGNFPTHPASVGPKEKPPGLLSIRGFFEPSIDVRLNSGGPQLNWGHDVRRYSVSKSWRQISRWPHASQGPLITPVTTEPDLLSQVQGLALALGSPFFV